MKVKVTSSSLLLINAAAQAASQGSTPSTLDHGPRPALGGFIGLVGRIFRRPARVQPSMGGSRHG